FNITNIPADNRSIQAGFSKKAIYSLYALASFGYDDQFYLDLTGRNDWASTLPSDNRSHFYPSASVSWLTNYTFNLPEKVDLLKVRLGWAQVGNDTDPYAIEPKLLPGTYNSINIVNVPSGLLNPAMKPEQATSIEGGIDLAMFGN